MRAVVSGVREVRYRIQIFAILGKGFGHSKSWQEGAAMPRAARKKAIPKIKARRATRPRSIAIWLDSDVIDHFRALGKGWQARMNATLRKATGL
jgi:uncharacterized protein (DUF4415 family)